MQNTEERYALDSELVEQVDKWVDVPKLYMWDAKCFAHLVNTLNSLATMFDEEEITYKMTVYPCPLQLGDVIVQIDMAELIVRRIEYVNKILEIFKNFEIYPTSKKNLRFKAVCAKALLIKPIQ